MPIDRTRGPSPFAQRLKSLAALEPAELKAVSLSLLYFFFLFGSYSILKPVRDAMATVYGMKHIQELFTGTFLLTFVFAPLYSGLAARLKLSAFLPGCTFVGVTLAVFYGLFVGGQAHDDVNDAASFACGSAPIAAERCPREDLE